ncbi:30S ribosomal protein S20 [Secundilactobacillus oryzae JCM 18671]|uniref:Small ribosomal subunit protein bS20 n=1 Tax=Secundilactobacillus oryzae JCM 18671 TaxID=1291743 RepID=A0A081BGT0_9LACO|nr:30S ribosomal protein S20 [Secundilactobacillus oryzae]GAK47248.1 30S ribosomal protein S20 [Secundilactobacillus oryzae JCM 18671]
MPIIKSAIERARTNVKANKRNAPQLSAMRTSVKKFETAVTKGDENVADLFKAASAAVDHAASKGLIKKNKASRDKSRMAARLAKAAK